MNTTKSAAAKAPRVQPAPLGKIWKGYTSPGIYEVTQAVTADGEWLIERMDDGTWFVGHLPTKTEVQDGFKTLNAARVYIASGKARAAFEALTAPAPAGQPEVTDIIHLAHVADAITEVTGDDDYDDIADQAARLLDRVPSLDREAARYSAGTIEWEHFTMIVRAALDVPAEPKAHAEAGAGFPLCGWIRDGETVTPDESAVTCRFCRDRANADRWAAQLVGQPAAAPF